MPELTDLVPGFDSQQSFGLRTVAQEAARAALDEFRTGGCRVNCQEMTDVHRAVFGATEDGVRGLDKRVEDVEKSLSYAGRAFWIALGALIVAGVSVFVH